MTTWRTRAQRALAAVILAGIALSISPVEAARADGYVAINGAGSSWSSNAIDQWRRNVKQFGMQVNYASTGSSDGRNQFKAGTVDFASSEIPYGLSDGGVVDNPPTRGYAYMPIVAGGTAFMYNLTAGTKQITNLRLSGDVLTKIFTGGITSWDDAAIRADNPGLTLPKRKIVPVVRSDGSGSTAQFASWMASQQASTWNAYCAKAGRATPCGSTSNYPTVSGLGFIAQPGSQGVAGYVAQKANVGTITYVEYSYALKTGFPVAKILNKAGYYVEPTASNVAVALLKAKINTNEGSSAYLTQILTGVYNSTDPRTYPLSSYSYIIVPTRVEANFTEAKGKTLGDFAYYFLCEGQQQAEVLGYSPLPINLVKAGLEQVRKIPGVQTQSIDIKKCHNPTFSSNGTNTLAANAKQPAACDKKGAAQCSTGTGGSKTDTPSSSGGDTPTDGSTDGGTDGGTTGGTDNSGGGGGTDSGGGFTGGSTYCESDTGVCRNVVALPVSVTASSEWGTPQTLMLSAVLGLIALVIVPPLIGQSISTRRKRN
jgi:phosphate ABC transporter phosphate-binding protein